MNEESTQNSKIDAMDQDNYDVDDEEEEEEDEGIDYSDLTDHNLLVQLLMNQQLAGGIPITSRLFDKYFTSHFEAVSVSLQGYRDNNEDQHLFHFGLNNNANISVFGVFDGHGGDLVSKFVKNTLIQILEENVKNESFDDETLIGCIKKLDEEWIDFENEKKRINEQQIQQKLEQDAIDFTLDSDEKENDNDNNNEEEEEQGQTFDDEHAEAPSMAAMMQPMVLNEHGCVGSTLVFCIVFYNESNDNYEITTVNLGDSRSILLKKEEETYKLVELSVDHKPDNNEEKERIIKAGGEVRFNRVDGDLALSRAIGDTKYKSNKKLSAEEQKVCSVPTMTRTIAAKGDYLMLFCDGIVEYKENNDVHQFMVDALQKMTNDETAESKEENPSIVSGLRECELAYLANTKSLKLTPKHSSELKGLEKILLDLTEWALESGSKDNMTCMLIKIGKKNENESKAKIEYERIWSPCDFYVHKIKFNGIENEEIGSMDKEKMALDKFMRLFEADCSAMGWNMSDNYQNALLQKVLYQNDLITNQVQKREIEKLIDLQNNKLQKLEANEASVLGKKRKKMEQDDEELEEEMGGKNDEDMDENEDGNERKKRKLSCSEN